MISLRRVEAPSPKTVRRVLAWVGGSFIVVISLRRVEVPSPKFEECLPLVGGGGL